MPRVRCCAVLALGHLVGPLRSARDGGAPSRAVSKEKAAELRSQVAAIADASGLERHHPSVSPYPGKIISSTTGTLEVLSERSDGGALLLFRSGRWSTRPDFMPERSRELLGGAAVERVGEGRADRPYQRARRLAALRRGLEQPRDGGARLRGAGRVRDRRSGRMGGGEPWAAARDQAAVLHGARGRPHPGAPADEPSFRAFDLNRSAVPDPGDDLEPR